MGRTNQATEPAHLDIPCRPHQLGCERPDVARPGRARQSFPSSMKRLSRLPSAMTAPRPSGAASNPASIRAATVAFTLALLCLLMGACRSPQPPVRPSIEFTRLPPAGEGSPNQLDTIEGRVTGARPGQRVVLFARAGWWWVQPLAQRPFTAIQPNSGWKSSTHPGSAYAALLVDPGYRPPSTVDELPETGGLVRAVAMAEGPMLARPDPKLLDFSGYQWAIRQTAGVPGGSPNLYDPANVWVDGHGSLHLRISKKAAGWTSAEVSLSRSLGYGSYRFVVRDISHLEAAAVLAISTWDDSGAYREMDIEISRWGEPAGKNAQFVVQPYYVPANVVRFLAPPGPLAYSLTWEPRRVAFIAARQSAPGTKTNPGAKTKIVAAHVFTSGIPSPGSELLHLNLYVFDNKRSPLQHGVEVIVEKFQYLP